MTCSNCGESFDDSLSVCPNCGAYCGKPSSPGALRSDNPEEIIRTEKKVPSLSKILIISIGIPLLAVIIVASTFLYNFIIDPNGSVNSNQLNNSVSLTNHPILGKWEINVDKEYTNKKMIFDFREDGTILISVELVSTSGHYKVDSTANIGLVTVFLEDGGSEENNVLNYEISDNILILYNNESQLYFNKADKSEVSL